VAQRTALVRLREDAGACAGLTPAEFE
jgi:hypothetical protein